MNKKEIEDRERIYGNQRREYEACVRRIDNLIDMRANNELTEDEFKNRKAALLAEKDRLQAFLKDTDRRVESWLEVAERGLNFAEKARHVFATTKDTGVKRDILTALGSDLTLKDRKLNINVDNLLFPIQTMAKEVKAISGKLEPAKNRTDKKEIGQNYARNPVMLPG